MAALRCTALVSALHLGDRFSRHGQQEDRETNQLPQFAFFRQAKRQAAAPMASAFCTSRSRHPGLRCDEQPDRLKSWQGKWDNDQTAWHMPTPNPAVERFLDDLLPPSETPHAVGMGRRVLVPLCGKTVDMAYLSRKGYRVVGVEGVRKAIDEFAAEHGIMGHSVQIGLPPGMDPKLFRVHATLIGAGDGETTRAEPPPPVIIFEGDFLNVGAQEAKAIVPCDAAIDRGSLVAVLPQHRQAYARCLSDLIMPGGRVLLVTVEHDPFANQNGSLGPPFEVTEADVRRLFSAEFEVKLLLREDRFDKEPAWRKRGATRFHEGVYLLTKRSAASS